MLIQRRHLLAVGLALPATQALAKIAGASLDADCRRLSGDRLRIDWSAGGPVEIRSANRPDGPFQVVLAKGASNVWEGEAPTSPRPYFRLQGPAGVAETAERLLPLQGGRNFRDMGGYRSSNGRRVRWGRLYRSGTMVGLTVQDYAYLSDLGISVICDLRTTAERQNEPTRWPGANAPKIYSRDYVMDASSLMQAVGPSPTPQSARAAMINLYKDLPYQQAEGYTRLFHELAERDLPLAFNCSAGKDRTGVGGALVLSTLGVSRDQIRSDYALSDKLVNYEAVVAKSGAASSGFEPLARLAPEVREPFLKSDPAYVEAALGEIERREGSISNFLRTRLKVTPTQVTAIRERLLKRV